MLHYLVPFSCRNRSDLALRRQDIGALHHLGRAFFVEKRHQRFASIQLCDSLFRVELRVGPERVGCHLYRFLIVGRVGSERVLHTVSELAENYGRDIGGILRAEIDTYPFGADEANNLFHLFEQRLGHVVKQHVCFIKEENQFRLVHIAHFG